MTLCDWDLSRVKSVTEVNMAKKSSLKIPGLSFSWKRALGITKMKRSFAKATGIPTTKSGRRNKAGKFLGIK